MLNIAQSFNELIEQIFIFFSVCKSSSSVISLNRQQFLFSQFFSHLKNANIVQFFCAITHCYSVMLMVMLVVVLMVVVVVVLVVVVVMALVMLYCWWCYIDWLEVISMFIEEKEKFFDGVERDGKKTVRSWG